MRRDLIISCAALRRSPDWMPWSGEPPKLLEWPGVPTGGHPSWKRAADGLRDSDGALLPNLVHRYRQYLGADLGELGRIAVVGFSAGSNSGVRELLRSPLDRARLSFVGAIDGMHPMLAPRRIHTGAEDPTAYYADWAGQMGPFAAYALEAAQGQGGAMVCTASQVQPARGIAPTGLALSSLYQWIAERSSSTEPWMPGAFPPRDTSPALRAGEAYPTPIQIAGADRFVALWYAGSNARAHELQAYVVAPDVVRAFLVPLWGGADPILVGHGPEPVEPPIATPAPSGVRGLPNWTPAAVAAVAAVGGALV